MRRPHPSRSGKDEGVLNVKVHPVQTDQTPDQSSTTMAVTTSFLHVAVHINTCTLFSQSHVRLPQKLFLVTVNSPRLQSCFDSVYAPLPGYGSTGLSSPPPPPTLCRGLALQGGVTSPPVLIRVDPPRGTFNALQVVFYWKVKGTNKPVFLVAFWMRRPRDTTGALPLFTGSLLSPGISGSGPMCLAADLRVGVAAPFLKVDGGRPCHRCSSGSKAPVTATAAKAPLVDSLGVSSPV